MVGGGGSRPTPSIPQGTLTDVHLQGPPPPSFTERVDGMRRLAAPFHFHDIS
jgi:hypothetical protein